MNEVDFYLEDLKSKFKKINPKEYYLSYSGGKDSHLLYWFIKEYLKDTEIEIVACNTKMEHVEIRERMYKYSSKVLLPIKSHKEIKEQYGIPCFSKMQDDMINHYQKGSRAKSIMQFINGTKNEGGEGTWFKLNNQAKELLLTNKLHRVSPMCCKYLKKEPFKIYEKESGRKSILGVRGGESKLRNAQYKSCFTKDMKFTPLHDLTDDLVDKIYQQHKIEIPKVYDYVKRTGCMGCPYGSHFGDTKQELELLNENQFKFITEYFKESYEVLGIDTKNVQMKLF